MGTEVLGGIDPAGTARRRRHRIGSHGRGRLGMRDVLVTQGTVWFLGQARKRFGLSRALEVWLDRCGWSLCSSSASARPSIVQQEKQPQQSQQHQLIEKQVRNHGTTPSLGGEMGGFYLLCGSIELSAAWRYTTPGSRVVYLHLTDNSRAGECDTM